MQMKIQPTCIPAYCKKTIYKQTDINYTAHVKISVPRIGGKEVLDLLVADWMKLCCTVRMMEGGVHESSVI